MTSGKLMYFADDILFRVNTKAEAEAAITAQESLKDFDLIEN